jgi:outer membrane protein
MKKIGLNIIFVTLISNCFSQQLTLHDAINIALKNSFDIQIARNNEKIGRINNNIGMAGGMPVVVANGTDNEQVTDINQKYTDPTRNTLKSGVVSNNLSAGITGSILLYNGMRVISTKHQLEVLQQIDQLKLNAAIQDLLSSVILKYYDIVRQQSYLNTLQQSIDVSQKKLDIIQLRRDVGLANDADILQAKLDLNGQLQANESQKLIISQDKTDLLTFLSLNPDSSVEIHDSIPVDNTIQLNDVLSSLNTNADIQAADLQIKSNQWIQKQTAAQKYPSVKINGGYNFTMSKAAAGFNLLNQSNGPFVGISISVPIYNGSIYKRQEQIAAINTQNAEAEKNILLRNYKGDAVKTWQAYNNTIKQLKTETENNRMSAQLLDLIIKKFQLKQATIIDVKQAQQSFEESGYRLINLGYAAKSTEIELKRLLNTLSL